MQDPELMPEREDLNVQRHARSSYWPKGEDQRNDDGAHESRPFDAEQLQSTPGASTRL